jgi:probable DNA repair protein
MTVFKPTEIFRRLRDGHALVTANSRLARVLSGQYSQWRIQQGDRQWASPVILSWSAWLDRLWEQAALEGAVDDARAVPNQLQLTNLWEEVLAKSSHAGNLLRPQALAMQMRDTRRLAVEWSVDLNHPAWRGEPGDNHEAFRLWNAAFESLCRNQGWLPPEDRPGLLARAVHEAGFKAEETIDLLGFDEINPSQSALLTALRHSGSQIREVRIQPCSGEPAMWKADNHREELDRMARWVRLRFEESPGATIAVVVHDLAARRGEVENALRNILLPDPESAGMAEQPWNVSLGIPLSRVPMIESAFDILALLDYRVDIQTAGRVLRSPWIRGAAAERTQRSLLEARLREIYPRQFKPGEISYQAQQMKTRDRDGRELPPQQHQPRPWRCPELSALLQPVLQFARGQSGKQPPSGWADAFEKLLGRTGWPFGAEDPALSGFEHDSAWQAYQHWQDALRRLASLDATSTAIGRGEAIGLLQRICRESVFQPRSRPARIQVLGLYEISGLRFDHLWVLGLHNDNWPPPARPNPFIPRALQQQHGLPRSSPARELEVARTTTKRLLETARETVFSYPGQADGESLLPSPLLAAANAAELHQVAGWSDPDYRATLAAAPGPQADTTGPPGRLQAEKARGGTTILKNQALCPFRAFASNRLDAEGLESPVDGISPMLHGTLVHRVLEAFWKETKSRAALLQLSEEALVSRLRSHIDAVLNDERGLSFRPHFRSVEAARLLRLCLAFLELERERADFEVCGFEQEVLYQISGHTVRLVIDRVDRLADGSLAIIDYKTGKVDPKKWFGARPDDPQLPLYAVSAQEIPFGVVFAVIRDDECLFKGVVRHDGEFPGLPPKRSKTNEFLHEAGENLAATVDQWRLVLNRLMDDFLAGIAPVDPKEGRKTCDNSWCELHSLCRVRELEQHLARSQALTGAAS